MKTLWFAAAITMALPAIAKTHQSTTGAGITLVTIEQFECFWDTCPHYVISSSNDAPAAYIGLSVAKQEGGGSLKLPPSSFNRIVQKIERIKYFDLHKSYASKEDGCQVRMSDTGGCARSTSQSDHVE